MAADHGAATYLEVVLPTDLTSRLLTEVTAAFRCGPDEVLMAGLAVAQWRRQRGITDSDDDTVLVDVEGHRREPLVEGLDLSRTVGWFTSIYPVRLPAGRLDWSDVTTGALALSEVLKGVKEEIRRLPDKGAGYGLLRYLNPHTGVLLATTGSPQIGFNYLGRFSDTMGTVSGRDPEVRGIEQMVGLFINTVPVRIRLDDAEPLTSLLVRFQQEQAQLLPHQHIGLGEIQRLLGLGELFDCSLVYENFPNDPQRLIRPLAGGVQLTSVAAHDTPHFPLCLVVAPGDQLMIRLTHRPDLIARPTAERILAYLRHALTQLVEDPKRATADVTFDFAAPFEEA